MLECWVLAPVHMVAHVPGFVRIVKQVCRMGAVVGRVLFPFPACATPTWVALVQAGCPPSRPKSKLGPAKDSPAARPVAPEHSKMTINCICLSLSNVFSQFIKCLSLCFRYDHYVRVVLCPPLKPQKSSNWTAGHHLCQPSLMVVILRTTERFIWTSKNL